MMILNCVYHTARYFSLGSQYLSVGIERMAPSPTFAANLFADAPVTPGIAWPCWQSGNGEVKKEVEDLASKHIFFYSWIPASAKHSQSESCMFLFNPCESGRWMVPCWQSFEAWCPAPKPNTNQIMFNNVQQKKCYILEFIHWPHNAKLRKWHPRSQIAVV